MSKAQLARDRDAVLAILAGGPKSLSQIALQGGEGLWPALCSLVVDGKVEEDRDGKWRLCEGKEEK